MNETVRYTERWNGILLKPIAGHDWLTADAARDLYEKRPGPGVMVVGGQEDQGSGAFAPRWVIGFGVGPGVRVVFYNRQGTVVRLVDYDGVQDRLWRHITVDYVYENDTQRWSENEFLQEIEASVQPDGTGYLTTVEASNPTEAPVRTSTPIDVATRDAYWVDRPVFGYWDRLADPGPSAWEIAGYPAPASAR